jgi:hypothetical protein
VQRKERRRPSGIGLIGAAVIIAAKIIAHVALPLSQIIAEIGPAQ